MEPMPRLRVKKAWLMAAKITLPMPCSFMAAKLGIRKNLTPSMAPGRVREWAASTTISPSSPVIITLETRSTPFTTPKAQTPKEMRMVNTAQKNILPGAAVRALN